MCTNFILLDQGSVHSGLASWDALMGNPWWVQYKPVSLMGSHSMHMVYSIVCQPQISWIKGQGYACFVFSGIFIRSENKEVIQITWKKPHWTFFSNGSMNGAWKDHHKYPQYTPQTEHWCSFLTKCARSWIRGTSETDKWLLKIIMDISGTPPQISPRPVSYTHLTLPTRRTV